MDLRLTFNSEYVFPNSCQSIDLKCNKVKGWFLNFNPYLENTLSEVPFQIGGPNMRWTSMRQEANAYRSSLKILIYPRTNQKTYAWAGCH